jgi:hypothetical protein
MGTLWDQQPIICPGLAAMTKKIHICMFDLT